MWGVYPENFDWQVATVNSEFKLDAPISRKSPKTIENLHFLIQGNFQWIFLFFLILGHPIQDLTSESQLTSQNLWVDIHQASVLKKSIFHTFYTKMEISA